MSNGDPLHACRQIAESDRLAFGDLIAALPIAEIRSMIELLQTVDEEALPHLDPGLVFGCVAHCLIQELLRREIEDFLTK